MCVCVRASSFRMSNLLLKTAWAGQTLVRFQGFNKRGKVSFAICCNVAQQKETFLDASSLFVPATLPSLSTTISVFLF